jgi:hypothetical protein
MSSFDHRWGREMYSALSVIGRNGSRLSMAIFDSTPAVLHKEILWAMDRGVGVSGAASMGALRAAELHWYGMVGVG